ncbi:hypothetical protein [Actinoallomurus acaciae]|uniref:Uncharacterized protein n=1 Tax=Actinoallomurus acaciae TaxID=502577 RepID=A0ABV5YCS0_9ACTN
MAPAVIDALLAIYQNVGLFEKAVAAMTGRRAERQQPLDALADLRRYENASRKRSSTAYLPSARRSSRSLIHEVRVTGRHHIQPVFRLPSAYIDVGTEKLRELSGLAHPARHNKNLSPLIEGPVIQVAPVHAKIRRDGYRSQKTPGEGAGSAGVAASSIPAGPDQSEGTGVDGVGSGER